MKTNGKCNNSHTPRSCSLYMGISDLCLPVFIAIDLAHLSRYSQKGGGWWGGGKSTTIRSYVDLLHLNICKKISFDTSVKWIVEEFVEF